jgi:hypothetical protein
VARTGRPSKITESVTIPPLDGYGPERELPITDAICFYLEQGSYPANAAGACGISPSTFSNWLRYGAEWEDTPIEDVPEDRRIFVEFLERATRAEARGLVWHEQNVRRSASTSRDRDGRLSLEFLARRQPNVYSKRIEVKTDPVERRPAGVDADLAARAEETFMIAALPEDLTPDDFLPKLDGDEKVEAGAEATR